MLFVDLVQVTLLSSLGTEVRTRNSSLVVVCVEGKLFNVSSNPLTAVVYGPCHAIPMHAEFLPYYLFLYLL